MQNRGILIGAIFACAATSADAQWLHHTDSRIPRTKDGKPNLMAPAPRLNGKPDFSGVWVADRPPVAEIAKVMPKEIADVQVDLNDVAPHGLSVFWGLKPEEEPLRPEGAALLKQRSRDTINMPTTHCLPAGVPMSEFIYAIKLVQAPQEILMLSETGDPPRQIYTDGRELPQNPDPTWMGYSIGKWEGETLVVTTAGFNDRAWLDASGHPRSESMRITERYRRRDFGHLDVEITLDDPKYYTRPFSLKASLTLIPDSDILESVCAENEKDRVHLKN